MEKPKISPNFTIEDIHKIREYNYEITKHMTTEEMCDHINNKAKKVIKEMNEYNAKKRAEEDGEK